MRVGRAIVLILCGVALYSAGFWLSVTYWVWALIPLVGVVYIAAAFIAARLIVETFREIFGYVSLDWPRFRDEQIDLRPTRKSHF
jgi:hypothetical protein